MIAYIAGPMLGQKDHNFPAFHSLSRWLQEQGFGVHNPAEKETKYGTDQPDPERIPVEFGGNAVDCTPGDVFFADFVLLLQSEVMVLLPGWQDSTGAKAEVLVAALCQMPVYQARTYAGQWEMDMLEVDRHTIHTTVGAIHAGV